jgi:hypothetical protein
VHLSPQQDKRKSGGVQLEPFERGRVRSRRQGLASGTGADVWMRRIGVTMKAAQRMYYRGRIPRTSQHLRGGLEQVARLEWEPVRTTCGLLPAPGSWYALASTCRSMVCAEHQMQIGPE